MVIPPYTNTGLVDQLFNWINLPDEPPTSSQGFAAELYDMIGSVASIAAVVFAFMQAE